MKHNGLFGVIVLDQAECSVCLLSGELILLREQQGDAPARKLKTDAEMARVVSLRRALAESLSHGR